MHLRTVLEYYTFNTSCSKKNCEALNLPCLPNVSAKRKNDRTMTISLKAACDRSCYNVLSVDRIISTETQTLK